MLVSLTNNLTQTHVLYLESLSIEKARQCQRYELLMVMADKSHIHLFHLKLIAMKSMRLVACC